MLKTTVRSVNQLLDTMSPVPKQKTFIGAFAHTNEKGQLIAVERGAIIVENGKINDVVTHPRSVAAIQSIEENIIILKPGQFLIPGLIDCHIHATQLPNLGLGYDKELLDWLETYTFPLEKKYKNEKFAEEIFDAVVKRTIKQGTTTACYFASLYSKPSVILGQKVAELGQRALIGKLSMNNKRNDDYYETTQESIKQLKEFIRDIDNIECPRVKPVITPRFALSCDMKLMKELGIIAREKNLHVQSHISENLSEIDAVKNVFKECNSYAEVYDKAGLLTKKTVMAHGVHLTEDEITLLKERQTAVIHCPSSNTCLKSGLCDVQQLRAEGIKIGLGTDVSGGRSSSILDAMKAALEVSSHLSMLKTSYQALNYKDVFHLATLGGANALAMDNEIGNFSVGKEFDALLIDINDRTGVLDKLLEYTLEEKLQRLIYSGDDRNILEVYVSGRRIK